MSLTTFLLMLKGGAGSGNFGHSGRPGKVGGSSTLSFSRINERVWQGKQSQEQSTLSKLETGDIAEKMVIQALKDHLGVELTTLNVGMNNAPIDLGAPGMAVEVKGGLTSNSSSAQGWRATIGEPGKAEKALIAQMTPEEKKAHNQYKSQKILERKQRLLDELSEMSGEQVKGYTAGVILSPDGKRGDVFLYPNFHLNLRWSQYAVDEYHIGSYESN